MASPSPPPSTPPSKTNKRNKRDIPARVAAIEYDPESKPPLHKNRRFRVYSCLAIIVIIAVVAVVVVYVTKNSKGDTVVSMEVEYTPPPTRSPTLAPTTDREASGIKEQIEAGVLQRGATFANMSKTDPRYLALDWILHWPTRLIRWLGITAVITV